MLSIRNTADMARALDSVLLDPALRGLLRQRHDQLLADTDYDLADLMHLIVALPGDTLAAVEAEAGVSFVTNPVDGSRFGERGFSPPFEYVHRHGWWLEAVMILSDDGFGVVLLVPDRIDVDPDLLGLLALFPT